MCGIMAGWGGREGCFRCAWALVVVGRVDFGLLEVEGAVFLPDFWVGFVLPLGTDLGLEVVPTPDADEAPVPEGLAEPDDGPDLLAGV